MKIAFGDRITGLPFLCGGGIGRHLTTRATTKRRTRPYEVQILVRILTRNAYASIVIVTLNLTGVHIREQNRV